MANKAVKNTTREKIEIWHEGALIEIEGKDKNSKIPEEIDLPEGLVWQKEE